MRPSLLDVPTGPCGTVLEYADPPTRHALRAACRQLYLLRAVGCVRVPVHNPFALELCERAAGSTVTVPFWGCTASRVTLVHDRARQGQDPSRYRTIFAGFCRSLAALLGDHAPSTVEFRFIEGDRSGNYYPLLAMEALVQAPYWTAAELELRDAHAIKKMEAPRCSEELKARLVWCDLVITDWRPTQAIDGVMPFTALRNLVVSTGLSAAMFPALDHITTGCAQASPKVALRWLAPLGGQLRSVEWTRNSLPDGPLRLADQTQIQCTGSLGCLVGGKVESARLAGTETFHKRCFDAAHLEVFLFEQPGVERFIELNAPQSLPCRRLTLVTTDRVVLEQTALLLVERACWLHTLTLPADLVTPALVAALPRTLRVLYVYAGSGLPEPLEQLMRLPGLLRLSFYGIYRDDQHAVSTKVREFRAANPGLGVPTIVFYSRNGWSLESGAPAPGVVVDRVWIHTGLFADEDSANATMATLTGAGCEWDWARGVRTLEIQTPLGPGFWRAAPRLAGVFPCVAKIRMDSAPPRQDMDALRTLCLGLGPALRSLVGFTQTHADLFWTDELEQHCPWLTLREV